jgi:pyrroline-5-carboxylate reductase
MKENIGFIGAGNMAQALIQGWLAKNLVKPEEIFVSNRTEGKLIKLTEQLGVVACATNEELIDKCDVVILAVKPQDMEAAVEPIASAFTDDQVVISLAAGISLKKLRKLLPKNQHIVRLMANTPAKIMRGTFGYCTASSGLTGTRGENLRVKNFMERMFEPLGMLVKLDEGEQYEAFTVATSAGVGFVFELMIYWQEWLEERGIDPELAQSMTVSTFLGAAELALQSMPQSLADLQSQVTSKKGVTSAGLLSMRELEVERGLRYSFEKAAMRDRELSQD